MNYGVSKLIKALSCRQRKKFSAFVSGSGFISHRNRVCPELVERVPFSLLNVHLMN